MNAQFQLEPFDQARDRWKRLADGAADATLFHEEAWLKLIRQTYGLELFVASLGNGEFDAGCVLARSKNPLRQRLVSLPFSDLCGPLAKSPEARHALFSALAASGASRSGYEIRGVAVAEPWKVSNCFLGWTMDLERRDACRPEPNFRRQVRRAREAGVRVDSGSGLDFFERYYALELESRHRMGLPPHPWRLYQLAHRMFGPLNTIAVWIATANGRDAAGLIVIRHRDVSYYKWGARLETGPTYANHLLFQTAVDTVAGEVRRVDLGRTDARNVGLNRFKSEMGARANPLPYSFLPKAPANISPEAPGATGRLLQRLWRLLPLGATRVLADVIYGYLE